MPQVGILASSKAKRSFYALSANFHPQPNRSLDNGRWQLPAETSLGFVLGQMAVALIGSQPVKSLSPAGKQAALKAFRWTKVSTLTASELRQARLSFINDHPQLEEQPKELAKAMKEAGLWTSITELHVIVKQIARLK